MVQSQVHQYCIHKLNFIETNQSAAELLLFQYLKSGILPKIDFDNFMASRDPEYTIACMHVCKNIYVRAKPYSLDCHGGAMKMYHCARENTTDFSWEQNCVSDGKVVKKDDTW